MDYSKSKPGDNNYRAFIGPPMQYDFMGATQFRLLCTLGLRADHKVLDIGCGSLRAGRFLISYLEQGNYYGIEPNKWLIEEAIQKEVGISIIDIKKPNFDYNSEFDTRVFNTKFDFIIAQSIFSHTGLDLLNIALSNIKTSLTPTGCALVTFIKGVDDFDGDGWVYPSCVEFTESTILSFVTNLDLKIKELPWFHPRQTWFILSHSVENIPPDSELSFLSGAVLRSSEFKASLVQHRPQSGLKSIVASKALVVTGFHRSATSATANYLYDAGLDLGENLMEGNISNAKGHFEDWNAVDLHDALLTSSGTNWQFHDQCQLQSDMVPFQDYAQQRFNDSMYWGVKDPRACLFLDNWHEVLQENGRYLLIVRHWSSCIESLLHRHSRDFAHQLPVLNDDDVGLRLWLQPELAAKMWLSYNKRLLAFGKSHPDKVLLVTQRSLFEGAPIITALNTQFGFSLNVDTPTPFQSELLRDKASERILDSLSYAFRSELDSVWHALLSLADFKANNEAPVYTKSPAIDVDTLAHYQQALSSVEQVDLIVVAKSDDIENSWLNALLLIAEQDKFIKQLESVSYKLLLGLDIDEFLALIEQRYSINGQVLLSTGKLLMRIAQPTLATFYFQKAITVGVYYPYIDMLIGQCYQQISKYDEALFFFDKAIKNNAKNPLFYTNKAKCLLVLDENTNAESFFKLGYEKGSKQPGCVLPYCEFLLKEARESEAITLLEKLHPETTNPAAMNMLTRIKLSTDYQLGKASYLEQVKAKLHDKDRMQWLAQTGQLINNGGSEVDFILRVNAHWQEVEQS
jgi:SAM-dependent methyltransferase/tetratricopeptide (TPR) repeat protein